MHKKLMVIACLFTLGACTPAADTDADPEIIDANIVEDRTLIDLVDDPALPDYVVTVPIAAWANVVVDPGVRIEFTDDAGLWVGTADGNGSFSAVGTADKPIVFAGQSSDDGPTWRGIGFGTNSVNNRLHFVTIQDAGSRPQDQSPLKAGVTLWDGTLSIEDCTFLKNREYGFAAITSPGAKPTLSSFERNTLTQNGTPAVLTTNLIGAFGSSNTFVGNMNDVVEITAVDFGPTINEATTVSALDVPYRISGEVAIHANVDVAAGTRFVMAPDSDLLVGSATGVGSLAMPGTADAPITMIGEIEEAGSWGGIIFNSDSVLNVFDSVEIAYGGRLQPVAGQPANIVLGGNGLRTRLTLTNSTIRNSAGFGVYTISDATLTESGNTFADNASGDIGTDPI